MMFECIDKVYPSVSIDIVTGAICSFSDNIGGLPLKSCVSQISGYQEGSGTPSPSNPLPISGWDAINIGSDAKYAGFINFNQLVRHNRSSSTVNDVVFTNNNDGSWSVSGTASAEAIYYLTNDTGVGENHVILYSYGANSSASNYRIGDFNYGSSIVSGTSTTFIGKRSTASNFNIGVQVYKGKSIDIKLTPQVFDLTAMFGQTKAEEIYNMEQQTAGSGVAYFRSLFPNDYYDYNAETLTTVSAVNGVSNSMFTIQIGSTVYGGEYDARTGVLTVTHGIVDLGTLTWLFNAANSVLSTIDTKLLGSQNILSDHLQVVTSSTSASNMPDNSIKAGTTSQNVIVKKEGINEENAQEMLAGYKIVYELAIPITIQLPPCLIDTLLGENNVWADTGNTTLEYLKAGR